MCNKIKKNKIQKLIPKNARIKFIYYNEKKN